MKAVLAFIGAFFLLFTLSLFGLWLGISVATSTFKSLGDNCHKQYGIEVFVAGDLFCPRK